MDKNKRFCGKNRYGITMIALVITIIVSLIIISVGIATVSNSIADATLTAFADDLSTIQDQNNLYYLQNDAFPTIDDAGDALSQNQILDIVENNEKFIEELQLNNDYNENGELGEFYKIDMTKLNIEKTVRGTMADGDVSDIYVVSARTMNIYYLRGLEVEDKMYYSLSSKIIKYVKTVTPTEENTDETSIQTVGSLTAKISNKDWTNKLGITLNAYMNDGETLYLNIPDVGEKLVKDTSTGNNTFIFNSFKDIQARVEALADKEISTFSSKQGNSKYIEFVKRKNGTELDRIKIDLANCDTISPEEYTERSFKEREQDNVLTFKVSDNESGIKQVKYEYLKKYNEVGLEEDYYAGIEELTASYIKQKGKKATISDTENKNVKNVEISLPKEISKVQILILDNADNWTSITTSVSTPFYIGATLNTINEGGALFRVAFNNKLGINSYTISVSTNGKTYSSSITKTPNNSESTYYEVISNYKEGLSITDNLYIRISATDNNKTTSNRISKTRIFKYSLSDAKSSSYLEDNVVDMVSGVPIPKGFVASQATGENDKNNGLVIYEGTDPVTDSNVAAARTSRNQYVWIPVEYSQFTRAIPTYNSETRTITWNAPTGSYVEVTTTPEYIEMSESVKKYGGFYIARYEAGLPSNVLSGSTLEQQSAPKSKSLELCSQGVKPVSIKESKVWNYIPWGTTDNSTTNIGSTDPIDGKSGNQTADGAVKASRSVYPNVERLTQYGLSPKLTNDTGVISTLCYAVCRDSIMRFLSDVINPNTNTPYIIDSTGMGWYKSNFSTNWYATTGKDVSTDAPNKVKNIYDLGGNCLEWTMEGINRGSTETYQRSMCGGNFNGNTPASKRQTQSPATATKNTSFRVMLYIK